MLNNSDLYLVEVLYRFNTWINPSLSACYWMQQSEHQIDGNNQVDYFFTMTDLDRILSSTI